MASWPTLTVRDFRTMSESIEQRPAPGAPQRVRAVLKPQAQSHVLLSVSTKHYMPTIRERLTIRTINEWSCLCLLAAWLRGCDNAEWTASHQIEWGPRGEDVRAQRRRRTGTQAGVYRGGGRGVVLRLDIGAIEPTRRNSTVECTQRVICLPSAEGPRGVPRAYVRVLVITPRAHIIVKMELTPGRSNMHFEQPWRISEKLRELGQRGCQRREWRDV